MGIGRWWVRDGGMLGGEEFDDWLGGEVGKEVVENGGELGSGFERVRDDAEERDVFGATATE